MGSLKFNPFSGARRIAILLASIAVIGTVFALVTYQPYISADYSVIHPVSPFVKTDGSCPSTAGRHYFSRKTRSGESISITLCLHTMALGETGRQLIPYKVDDKGMVWGAETFSTEISDYEHSLEARFVIPPSDEEQLVKEAARRYRENWQSGLGYLAIGLAIFAVFVWAVGWVVRGFLGVPQGADARLEQTPPSDA